MKKYKNMNVSRFAFRVTRESGQILLILVMVIALVITIILTISFSARTDTQITQLEPEGQKAVSAAEAGIESSLRNNSSIGDLTTLGNLSSTIKSGSVLLTATRVDTFKSRKLVSGEAYTAYLGRYTAGTAGAMAPTPSFGNGSATAPSYDNSSASNLTICFGDTSSQPAIDIALIKDAASSPVVRHYLADPGNNFGGGNKLNVTPGCSGDSTFSYSVVIPAAEVGTDSKLLVMRVLCATTQLFISQVGLPAQGKTVTSEATSKAGSTKKIQLFQSYPQLPAEFFFTTF